jgi:hypothetical protein
MVMWRRCGDAGRAQQDIAVIEESCKRTPQGMTLVVELEPIPVA